MELLTKRFLLRDFVAGDAPAFEAYHADPQFLEFYGAEAARPGHTAELLELFKAWADAKPRVNYQLAVVKRDQPQRLIGCCGLRCAGLEPGTAELGIELAREYWGRYKYAVEIIQALADFGFQALQLEAIQGSTVSANSRIGRLLESFGATASASARPAPAWMDARGWSSLEWRLTKEHWST